jgi:hypothetical protein
MQDGDFSKAANEAAIAKAILFARLDHFVPKVDRSLRDMDSVVHRIPELRGSRIFQYITDYLEILRETTLASLLKLPLQDYTFLRKTLPTAYQMGSGEWHTNSNTMRPYDEAMCKRAVACLVNFATRLESVI